MLDIGLGIVDRLIQLVTVREHNREKYFHEFIQPLYDDAEKIVQDYTSLLVELIQQIRSARSTKTVVDWIEQRRHAMLPLRTKVRALIADGTVDPDKVPEEFKLFVKGLWGVMRGGVSLVEQGHATTWEYGFGDHTVLDLMKRFSDSSPLSPNRERYIRSAQAQLAAIEAAWKDASKGYAILKRKNLRPV